MSGVDKMRRLLDARRKRREQEARDVAAFAARTQAEQDEQIAKNEAAAADESALQARIRAENARVCVKPQTVKQYLAQNPEAINGPFVEIDPSAEHGALQSWRVRINGEVCKPSFCNYADAVRYFKERA